MSNNLFSSLEQTTLSTTQTPSNSEKIKGLITKINNGSKENWCSGKILLGNREEKFKGRFLLAENDTVILTGKWLNDAKWGLQFDAASFEYDLQPKGEALATFLEKNPAFYGIGKVRARKIAEKFSSNFEEILFEQPMEIQKLGGIPEKAILILQDQWREKRRVNLILTELITYGLSYAKANRLLEDRGETVISELKENPYQLIDWVEGFGFKTIDNVALKMGFNPESELRIAAAINFQINKSIGFGHCWIEVNHYLDELQSSEVLNLPENYQRGLISSVMSEQVRLKRIIVVTIEEKGIDVVAPYELYQQEMFIIETFNNCVNSLNAEYLVHILENETIKDQKFILNEKQYQGALNILKYNITLITGYAGTGKTASIIRILKVAQKAKLKIALAAPTGKAAKRIQQATDQEASTIHRLLGYNTEGFSFNEDNPLEYDIVIIDETSMVDVSLMYHLLKAIDFHKTRLVLTGDHNQLPPVGQGNILRDLINKETLPMIILSEVMRNSGDLRKNAEQIIEKAKLNGNSSNPIPIKNNIDHKGFKEWYLIDTNQDDQQILDKLMLTLEQKLENYNFNLLKDVQIITPMHKGLLGTKNLNLVIQKLIQKKLYAIELPEVVDSNKTFPKLLKGDKVIQKKNNYKLGVMNGTQGIIQDIYKVNNEEVLEILFDNEEKTIMIPNTAEFLEHLELAYAITCHSAQGSQWPCVIVVMSSGTSFMFKNQNWLYTAVTRAEKTALIFSNNRTARESALNPDKEKRQTFAQFYLKKFNPNPIIVDIDYTTVTTTDDDIDNAKDDHIVIPTVSTIAIPTNSHTNVTTEVEETNPVQPGFEEMARKEKSSLQPLADNDKCLSTNSDEIKVISIDCDQGNLENNLVENLNTSDLQSENFIESPAIEKTYQTVKKQINIFDDNLADEFPIYKEIEVLADDSGNEVTSTI